MGEFNILAYLPSPNRLIATERKSGRVGVRRKREWERAVEKGSDRGRKGGEGRGGDHLIRGQTYYKR